ncbi:MAG: hypothetical protein JRN08_06055 [Nitrososphaerota archaeon]|nr:hypothetical protein [Nitrososphaerota archaeon]
MRNTTVAVLLIALVVAGASTGYWFGVNSRKTQTTTSTTSSAVQPCGDSVVQPSDTHMIPVLLMQPGTTAYACVTYQTYWKGDPLYDWAASPGRPFGPYQFYPFDVANEQCASNGCWPDVSNAFEVSVLPATVNLTAYSDYVVVLYTITALANSTGYYSNSVPYFTFDSLPMAVGHAASDVSGSDFGPLINPVGLLLPMHPVSLSVSGMGVIYLEQW